jgi:hypothetical protein
MFQDPWVGTDTPGPGEAVFAIRFEGKPLFLLNKSRKMTPEKLKNKRNIFTTISG